MRLEFKALAFCILSYFTLSSTSPNPEFKIQQLKFKRVKHAFETHEESILKQLQRNRIDVATLKLMFVAFKYEKELQIWAEVKKDEPYKLMATFPVCALSGKLGPKRLQGDYQVPEGIYNVERFNPASSYHLSLGLDYPNASDKYFSLGKDPGNDIFIHGDCVTVGCLPMTDEKIEEIYTWAVLAKTAGQSTIPVYIFPIVMNATGMEKLRLRANGEPVISAFWNNLKPVYDRLIATNRPVPHRITEVGRYELR